MPKIQKRGNEYYEKQLKDRYPAIHADYRAGKFRSLRKALIAAGIRRDRTRLLELKNAWTKATDVEKRTFLQWARQSGAGSAPASRSVRTGASRQVAVDRRLEPWAIQKIQDVMGRRGLKMGDVALELGLSRLNASIGMAMSGHTRLQPAVIIALERWLDAH